MVVLRLVGWAGHAELLPRARHRQAPIPSAAGRATQRVATPRQTRAPSLPRPPPPFLPRLTSVPLVHRSLVLLHSFHATPFSSRSSLPLSPQRCGTAWRPRASSAATPTLSSPSSRRVPPQTPLPPLSETSRAASEGWGGKRMPKVGDTRWRDSHRNGGPCR